MKPKQVHCEAVIERLADGTHCLTLQHPKHHGPWAKFKVAGGGNLLLRAVNAVYGPEHAGDADAYFHAQGMSDADAFNANTWKG